jgi:phosphomannomutase
MKKNYKSLQNGSDIRGIALPGVVGEDVNLTVEVARDIGLAFTNWLKGLVKNKELQPIIGVGMDSRISGPTLKAALIEGLTEMGANVLDFDLATTPSLFMSTQFKETNCDGGIMITASHLPPNRNGFKFFTRKAGLEKGDISEILSSAETIIIDSKEKGTVTKFDLLTPYSNFIINFIRNNTSQEEPLKGMKIVVDAGNGAGGFFASKILEHLGADTQGSIFLEPDGTFPNHAPNPEDKEAIKAIQNAVTLNKADLGIIFDTDVDRAAVVDSEGQPINRNALIALLASIILEEHPSSYIVTDSVTSEGLAGFINELGGKHHRFRRGYKNVINEAIKLNTEGKESWLAIETSGHAAFKENFFLDDGAFLVAKVLVKVALLNKKGESLSTILTSLEEPAEAAEFRIKIEEPDFKSYGESIINDLKQFIEAQEGWQTEKENFEGIRAKCSHGYGDGWFLLRLSLHDPVLPLNIESNIDGGTEQISTVLREFFQQHTKLSNISLT